MTQVFTGPSTITIHPTSQLTNVSMSVTLDCEVTRRGSITYHWETSNINGGQWMNISNSNSKTLVVRNLEQSQQYRCVVSNETGSIRSDVANVTVLSELFISIYVYLHMWHLVTEITTQPINSTVIALEDVTLNCSASVDDIRYSWHRVDGDLPAKSSGQHSNTLTINKATPHDEGMYYCKASKSGISTDSRRAIVKVDGEE